MLPVLAVVFAGILGNGVPEADQIAMDIASAVETRATLTPVDLPPQKLAAVVHNTAAAKKVITQLAVDGVIAGEVKEKRGQITLTLVVYSREGVMRSSSEVVLTGRALDDSDLDVIRQNLGDEALALSPGSRAKPKARVAAKKRAPAAAVDDAPVAMAPLGDDDEDPLAKKKAAPAAKAAPKAVAAATDGDDAPLGESAPSADAPEVHASASPGAAKTILHVGAGLGVVGRSFATGAVVPSYSGSPVPTAEVYGDFRVGRRVRISGAFDRTLTMHTATMGGTASSSITHWEIAADVAATTGKVVLAGRLGAGRRWYAVDADETGRSPDRDYGYVIAGATLTAPLSNKIVFSAVAAVEPVAFGTQPHMAEGTRYAAEVGASLDVALAKHAFARFSADLQRFAWTWTDAGGGSASDLFPSAMASVGASY